MGLFLRSTGLPLLILCLGVGIPGPIAGQTSDQDLMSLSIEDLSHVKVYSASRHLEEIRESPSSVSVITSEDIRRYGWRTLADVLRSLRGFYTSYDRNYSYLGVRGVLRPGDYNSRVLFLLNGHRLNDNVYGEGLLGTEFPFDLDLIDHIEVVRGPGSSLFGTNAVFGVINIISKTAVLPYAIEVSGDVSSFMGRTGRVTGSFSRAGLSALVSGTMYETAGPPALYFPEFASRDTNRGFADNIDGDRYAQAFSDVQFGKFRVQGLFSSRRKIIPTASYNTNFNDPGTRTTDTSGYFDVDYRRNVGPQTEFDLRGFYDHYDYSGSYAYGGINSPDRYLNFDSSVADWSGLEATLNRKIAGRHRLIVGASYEYSFRVDQQNNDAGQAPVLNDHRTPWLAATFAEAEFKLGHSLALHAGARLDYFKIYEAALSPRAALVYSPNARTTLKYIFGRAFRSPNAYESYYADGVSQEIPVRPLQKENIQSHEVVFDRGLNSWIGITLDGYYNNLDHLIDFAADPANNMFRAVNSGKVRGRGLEFEVFAKRSSGWQGRASYAISDAYDGVSLHRLDNSPLHQGKLNGTIPLTRHAFAGLEMQYFSAQQSYQQTRVSPAFLMNLTVSSKPFWGGWEASASGYNLLDRRWFSPAGPSNTQAAIQQDGRTLRCKISYRFGGEKRGNP